MRTTLRLALTGTVLATALACGSGKEDAVPRLSEVSSTADAKVDLIDRQAILAEAADFDVAPKGDPIDFDAAPAPFYGETDNSELTQGADDGTVPAEGATYQNYLHAVGAVVAADVMAALVVGPPAIGVAVAADGTCLPLEDNVWTCENTVELGGQDVTGTLTVAWVGVGWLAEMRLTTEDGNYDHTLWFNGFLAYGGGLGWWDLYNKDGSLAGVVEWIGDGAGNAEFGIASTSGAYAGSALVFARNAEGEGIVAAYDATRAETAWVYSAPDQSGEVRLPDYNGGAKACWDVNYVDVACAAE